MWRAAFGLHFILAQTQPATKCRLATTLGLTVVAPQTLKIAENRFVCSWVALLDQAKVFKCEGQALPSFVIGKVPMLQPLSFVCGRPGKSPNLGQGNGFPLGARSTRCSQFLVGTSRRRAATRSQFVGAALVASKRPKFQRGPPRASDGSMSFSVERNNLIWPVRVVRTGEVADV